LISNHQIIERRFINQWIYRHYRQLAKQGCKKLKVFGDFIDRQRQNGRLIPNEVFFSRRLEMVETTKQT